jgi:uncharacterized membrane protein HdeD (DUF308 family)
MIESLPLSENSSPRSWRSWLLALGASLVPPGLAVVGAESLLILFGSLILLPLMILCGIIQLLLALLFHESKDADTHLLAAILSLPVAFEVLSSPTVSAVSMGVILAAFLLSVGLVKLVWPALRSTPGWWTIAVLGIMVVLLGIAAVGWGQGIVLGLFLVWMGFDILGHGFVWVILDFLLPHPPQKL